MRAIMKLAALFSLLIAAMLFSQASGAEDWFAQGLSALRSHHYDKAVAAFSMAVEMNPKHLEAYNNRGITWFKKGDYERALRDYNQALELDPRCAEVYNNRGIIWYYSGQYDLAIHDYDKALGIAPRFDKALSNRGAAWFCKGNGDMAIRDYKRALEINPNALETSQQLAWILSVYSENVKEADAQGSQLKRSNAHPQALFTGPFVEEEKPVFEKAADEKTDALLKMKGPSKKPIAPQKPPLPPSVGEPGRVFKPKGELKLSRVEPMKISAATGNGSDSPGENLHNEKNADESPDVNLTGTPAPGAAFSIQVGAFASREKAERLTARLMDKGYAARLLPLDSWSNRVLYAVRIGKYATRKEAEEKAAAFSDKEGMPAIVRSAYEL